MDIRDWPIDKIMQLPDNCFGRRWPIVIAAVGDVTVPKFDIAEMALPEVCVIWEFQAMCIKEALAIGAFEIRLGDVLPTTWVEFQALELLFGGIHFLATADSTISTVSTSSVHWTRLKMPVRPAGRRFVMGVLEGTAAALLQQAAFVVSSIPSEVPDCLLSV